MDIWTIMILIWFAVIIISVVIEANTFDLTSIWLAAGALVSLFLSIFKIYIVIQISVFIVISGALLILVRPLCTKYFKKDGVKTNSDSLIGGIATVTKEIPVGERGEVKIDGKIWTAISEESNTILVNEKVVVLGITGVKLIVRRNA